MFLCERKSYLVVLITMEIASIYNEVRATCHLIYISNYLSLPLLYNAKFGIIYSIFKDLGLY